jgi:protein-S-isoprenylcysteine O-methyltransferase Ste14
MSTFDKVRYGIALILAMTGPGAAFFWLPVHPLARFWRRVGFGWAYLAGLGVYSLVALLAWRHRDVLLSVDFGASTATLVAGVALAVVAGVMRRVWHRQLSIRTLFGLPELAPDRYPPRLLTEGAYAWVRHPRYVEVILGFTGYALISNYLAAYGAAALVTLGILVVIPLEERELVERFGFAYEAYRARVPALIPRRPLPVTQG